MGNVIPWCLTLGRRGYCPNATSGARDHKRFRAISMSERVCSHAEGCAAGRHSSHIDSRCRRSPACASETYDTCALYNCIRTTRVASTIRYSCHTSRQQGSPLRRPSLALRCSPPATRVQLWTPSVTSYAPPPPPPRFPNALFPLQIALQVFWPGPAVYRLMNNPPPKPTYPPTPRHHPVPAHAHLLFPTLLIF